MNCEEFREKWEDYVEGKCPREVEREIEQHLHTCTDCEEWVNEKLEQQTKDPRQNVAIPELSYEQQQQIFRYAKWKNRFMNAVTVLGIFFCISIASYIITAVYYAFAGHTANKVIQTAIQMTMPNVYSHYGVTNTKVFFNADLQGNLYKSLGNEEKYVGEYQGKMTFEFLNLKREWVDGQYDKKLYFLHPELAKEESYDSNDTWHALNMLPEGTVSELAVSFDDVYTFEEVYEILDEYDLDIVWYAIDTGIDEEFSYWGIHEEGVDSLLDEEERELDDVKGESIEKEKAFKNGLELINKHKRYAKKVVWGLDEKIIIEEIIDYVDQNGVKTYGVVVTGPTKELLKLKENEQIYYATLGEADFWNWFTRERSGAIAR